MQNKIVYLPIELKAREFEAKTLLAFHLLQNGYDVVIGQQWELYRQMQFMPKGLFIFKSHNAIHLPAIKAAKELGHIVFAQEEEILGITEFRMVEKNTNKEIYSVVDKILASSEFEKECHLKRMANKNTIEVVGNLRIDLLKPKYIQIFKDDIKNIINEFGKFILINTNYGTSNNQWGDVSILKDIELRAGSFIDKEAIDEFEELIKWELINRGEMHKAIIELALKYKDINFVIRPHPAERLEPIILLYENFKNIHVRKVGSHLPWTKSSFFLMHSQCSTGYEGEILGKKTLNLVPKDLKHSQQNLSDKMSKKFRKANELINYVDNLLTSNQIELISEVNLKEYSFYIENIENNTAFDNILRVVNLFKYSDEGYSFSLADFQIRHPRLVEKCFIKKTEILNLLELLKNIEYKNTNNFDVNELGDSLFFLRVNNNYV